MSASGRRVAAIRKSVETSDVRIALLDDTPVGVLTTSDTPKEYVEPVDEPELYVTLLLTSRRYAGHQIGAQLLAFARTLAAERGVTLMRVDCNRGPDESLVRYYERNGFVRTQEFDVDGWPGQVLEQRLG